MKRKLFIIFLAILVGNVLPIITNSYGGRLTRGKPFMIPNA